MCKAKCYYRFILCLALFLLGLAKGKFAEYPTNSNFKNSAANSPTILFSSLIEFFKFIKNQRN